MSIFDESSNSISQERMNIRKEDFKRGINVDDSRRKRVDQAISLRKNKREERLAKRRHQSSEVKSNDQPNNDVINVNRQSLYSDDPPTALESLIFFRRMSSTGKTDGAIKNIADMNITEKFVEFLSYVNYPKHQYEAAWLLTNLVSGSSKIAVPIIENTKIGPYMIELLNSPAPMVMNQAVWGITNIAGEAIKYRDIFLNRGVLSRLVQIISGSLKSSKRDIKNIRIQTWALSVLVKGRPLISSLVACKALPVISYYFNNCDHDYEITENLCWAMARISGVLSDVELYVLFTTNIINSEFVKLLCYTHDQRQTQTTIAVLRTLGNVIAGTNEDSQKVLDLGFLNYVETFINNKRCTTIKKEMLWILSNIAAGTHKQIDMLIAKDLITFALRVGSSSSWVVKKECCYLIINVFTVGTFEQIDYVIKNGGLKFLGNCLNTDDKQIVVEILTAIKEMLDNTSKTTSYSFYCNMVEETCLDQIERCQDSDDLTVYDKALKIIERHYNDNSE